MIQKFKKKIIPLLFSALLTSFISTPVFALSGTPDSVSISKNATSNDPKTPDNLIITDDGKEKNEVTKEDKKPWVGNEKQENYTFLTKNILDNKVKEIELSNTLAESLTARVTLKDDSRYTSLLPDRTLLLEQIQKQINTGEIKLSVVPRFEQLINVSVDNGEPSPSIGGIILDWFLTILRFVVLVAILGMVLLIVQKYGMGILSRTDKKKTKAKDLKVTFDDIQGIDEAKRDVKEIVDFMNNEELYDKLGANIPHGIMLSGDPGSGKTMLAKAVAKELKGDFYQMSGSEFVEMFVGLGAGRIRSLFKQARKSKKAVIFIDEIDSIGKKRGGRDSHGETEQTLNQLLVELDGFNTLSRKKKGHVLVIAATNRIDVLDEALLRPGRFDRNIKVSKPNKEGRKQILRVYLKKYAENNGMTAEQVEESINIERLSRITEGFSGAELANLVNEALIKAGKRYALLIKENPAVNNRLTEDDLLKARDKILLGDPRSDLNLLESEIKTTAYHEAGHAIIALKKTKDPVEKVTIVPHSWALGLMLQIPERESVSYTKEDLMAKMEVLMAGRAAEDIFVGKITTGASNDMERAAESAMSMISRWGFGNTLGLTSIPDLRVLSDITRASLEKEARDLVEQAYSSAKLTLMEHTHLMNKLVEELLEKETINRDEIYALWSEYKDVKNHSEEDKNDFPLEGRHDDRMEEVLKLMSERDEKDKE